ncbi:MAG: hypothetical protein HXY51_13110, partial [Nitrospirae bacterium]|nr:hypothetical protein [Nitrospirota bacterium]
MNAAGNGIYRRGFVFLLFVFVIVFASLSGLGEALAFDVTLAWDPNAERDLAGYKVYYGTAPGGPYNGSGSGDGASPILVPISRLAIAARPEFTIRGLPDGTYYFVATAYNRAGLESAYSNEARTQASNPQAPQAENSPAVLSSLEVNGQSGSYSVYTSNRKIAVRIAASDNTLVSQYLILDGKNDPTGQVFQSIPGGPRQNAVFTINDFVLSDKDGNHTIYAWVKDEHGLISAKASKTNVILERIYYSLPNSSGTGDATMLPGANPLTTLGTPYGSWSKWVMGWMWRNTARQNETLAVDLDKDGSEELVAPFEGYGLYVYRGAKGWSQINSMVPEAMIRWNNGSVCDYVAASGVWAWTQAGGWEKLNTVDPALMMAVDFNNDRQDELVITFSGYGLWTYGQASGWSKINNLVPEAII